MTKSSLLRSARERKFTPPTKFPTEYVDGEGNKVVILGRGPHKVFPFIGYDFEGISVARTEGGGFVFGRASPYDLHDIPKRITTWHNVYGHSIHAHANPYKKRTCVYRIERDEDGGNPEIFVEDV